MEAESDTLIQRTTELLMTQDAKVRVLGAKLAVAAAEKKVYFNKSIELAEKCGKQEAEISELRLTIESLKVDYANDVKGEA